MTLRSIRNHRNFFSDYWLGTLLTSRRAAGPRLNASELRQRMRRVTRLIDSLGGANRVDPARFRERFARPLLCDVLDFVVPDFRTAHHVHPLHRSGAAEGEAPIALVYLCHDALDIDRRAVRQELEAALEAEGLDHGLIVTPELVRLIRRAGDGPRQSALDVALSTLRELEDDDSLQAAYRLISAGSFVVGENARRPIDELESASREHSAQVSSELKQAVFSAAELLVGAFQRDVAERPGEFGEQPPTLTAVRDAGFLALYRLLFILYAESRDDRLAIHRLYREAYGLDSLISAVLGTPDGRLAANRSRLWARLHVLFRVFNDGLTPNLPNLDNIPPRGGRLFSDETPEGALLNRLELDDRACASILLALATTRPRRGVGRERVSFRELEIEQLGSVYEGLLEYEPAVAEQLRLEVRVGGRELALTPEELAFLCEHKQLRLSGDASLVVGTSAERLHPGNAADDEELDEDADDDEPGDDDRADALKAGQPIRLVRRLEPGTFYFRAGGARKASGSFYTPTPMVDFLVRKALGPLVEGRSAREIEQLRVVDLACGSAHFLVGAARFLAASLLHAHRAERGDEPPPEFVSLDVAPPIARARWAEEGAAWCKRRIVERCLYGVDLNPAAVQLAQVALWIESLAGDRPLSFFAHHIRVGNSLQGTFADRFDSPPDPRLISTRGDTVTLGLFESSIRQRIEASLGERRLIDAELPPEIRADTPEEFQYKEGRLRRSEAALAHARLLMDLRSAAPYVAGIWPDLAGISAQPDPESVARGRRWWPDFETTRARERFFHWELEFPEVMLRADRPGFDAVLGNPPWDKVLPSKLEFYGDVDPLLVAFKGNELDRRIGQLHRAQPGLEDRFEFERERTTTFARVLRKGGDFPLAKPAAEEDEEGGLRQRKKNDQNAHEDLAKYFVDRSLRLARRQGSVGLVVPAVVYNGDGSVGIRQFLLTETQILAFYAFENRRRIFPIHASYRFANLVTRIGSEGAGQFDAAFMRHDVAELLDDGPKPWMVHLTLAELQTLSPETLAILEFRGPRDQEIVLRMSSGKPSLGSATSDSWGTRLIGWRQHEVVFNSSTDSDLFKDASSGRAISPGDVLGHSGSLSGSALYDAMRDRGYWPVFGGEQVTPFLVGVKPVRRWLSVSRAHEKYGDRLRRVATVVFRDQARSTDERSCIAAVIPAMSAAAYTLTAATFSVVDSDAAVTVLNSLAFDFLLRFRLAGMHVSGTYILPVAVPSATVVNTLPRLFTRLSASVQLKHMGDNPEGFPRLWAADRGVAEAYGIGAEDFAHILYSFPVWLRKRAALADFYLARLEEWRREQQSS